MPELESAAKPVVEAGKPRVSANDPSAATIAPLSVQRMGEGVRNRIPAFSARACACPRSLEFAATPPAITKESIPVSRQAAMAFRSKTSTIAS